MHLETTVIDYRLDLHNFHVLVELCMLFVKHSQRWHTKGTL